MKDRKEISLRKFYLLLTSFVVLGVILTFFLVALPTAAQSPPPFKLTAEKDSSGRESSPAAINGDVLWEQPSAGTWGALSQDMTDYGIGVYSADDFENTEAWELDRIFVDGFTYFGDTLDYASYALNWYIYADAGGVPAGHPDDGGGTELWSYSCLPTDPEITFSGDFGNSVTLDIIMAQGSTINLPPGRYWLVFFPSMDYDYEIWYWLAAGGTDLVEAHLIDPYDLFGAGFTTWTSWYTADPAGNIPDLAFRLEGDAITADWGDAPDPQYPTLAGNNGARHTLIGPTLGVDRDGEADGQPTVNADGDNVNGSPDDEDGISFVGAVAASEGFSKTASIILDLQNPDATQNKLDAWIDFNLDGDWDDPGEQIFGNYDLGTTAGVQTLAFTIPQMVGGNVVIGPTYARFRLSTAGGLAPTGLAADGEVEDYLVTITKVGELQCSIAAATYTFTTQSGVIIEVEDTGTDLACLYVEEYPGDHPNATDGIKTGKYWVIKGFQIDLTTLATQDFTVTLTLPHSVTLHANTKICKYTGVDQLWDCDRTSSTGTTVTRENLSSLSDWAVGDSVGPTAVGLAAFQAVHDVERDLVFWLGAGLLAAVTLGGWRLWLLHKKNSAGRSTKD